MMRRVGGCSLRGCCLPVVMSLLPQCIEPDFKLIFDVIAVEELSRMFIEPGGLFSCEWAYQLENQVTLSPLHLRSNTQLRYLKSGLVLQISLRTLLQVSTPTFLVKVLISEHQDEIASREMLEDFVQSDIECAVKRWGRLRGTSFWDGHFVLVLACLANVKGIGLLFHRLLLSTVRLEHTLQRGEYQ